MMSELGHYSRATRIAYLGRSAVISYLAAVCLNLIDIEQQRYKKWEGIIFPMKYTRSAPAKINLGVGPF